MKILFKRHLEEDAQVIAEEWSGLSEAAGMQGQLIREIGEATNSALVQVITVKRYVTGNQHPGRRRPPNSTVYYDFTIEFPHLEKTSEVINSMFDGIVWGKWEILETKAKAA
jgi:hypothetical protein